MSNDKGLPIISGPAAAEVSIKMENLADNAEGQETMAEFVGVPASEIPGDQQEVSIDPEFPFGRPENIDWSTIDQAGISLLHEVNNRIWMKSTEYCSGHPLDRPEGETSVLYPYRTGENVYGELSRLDMAFVRGLLPDMYFRARKRELREQGSTRFYLNVNVYDVDVFQSWIKTLSSLVMVLSGDPTNPVRVTLHSLRPGYNFSIAWDYWSMEERQMIHDIMLQSLMEFPV